MYKIFPILIHWQFYKFREFVKFINTGLGRVVILFYYLTFFWKYLGKKEEMCGSEMYINQAYSDNSWCLNLDDGEIKALSWLGVLWLLCELTSSTSMSLIKPVYDDVATREARG